MTEVLVVVIGLGGGVLAGLFGVGGGVLFVPTILPTAVVGTWRQRRYGNVDIRAAAIVGLASIGGVQVGVVVAESLPEATLRRLFGVFLLITAGHIAWRARRPS